MFYYFARGIARFVFRLFYKIEYLGKENIPEGGGYIVAANHRSLADPVFIGLAFRERLYYMAKKELFVFPLKYLFRALGAFPVDRGAGDTGALTVAEDIVREKKILGIFPQGKRAKNNEPLKPKSGVAVIAKATKADILPVNISFSGRLHFRSRVYVSFGTLIPYADLGIDEEHIATVKNASRLIMDRINELDPMQR